jgi:hypothetical protein
MQCPDRLMGYITSGPQMSSSLQRGGSKSKNASLYEDHQMPERQVLEYVWAVYEERPAV